MSSVKPIIRELKQAADKGFGDLRVKFHDVTEKMHGHLDEVIREVKDKDHFEAPGHPAATPRRPYNPIRGEDGRYHPGSLPSKHELRDLTKTDPDTAFYWSGRDAQGVGVGPDGSGIAESTASSNGGRTLEQTLAANGIDPLPKWNRKDPESVRFWEEASAAFAENASGSVRAVVGSDLRPGNIWQTVEIPRLQENPNVTSISQLDPDSGVWTRL